MCMKGLYELMEAVVNCHYLKLVVLLCLELEGLGNCSCDIVGMLKGIF